MSGSGLVNFFINLIALAAAGAIFFTTIDRVAVDAFFAKIAKIAIGAMLLIALVVIVAAVLGFGTGITISPLGVVFFAVAVIVAVLVLYLVNLIIDWAAANMGNPPRPVGWVVPVKYVIGAIVLIALLLAAADLLFGYRIIGEGFPDARRGEIPFPATATGRA